MAILLIGAVVLRCVGFAAATGRMVTVRRADGCGDDVLFDGVDGVGVDAEEFAAVVVAVAEVDEEVGMEVDSERVGRVGGVSLVGAAIFRGVWVTRGRVVGRW